MKFTWDAKKATSNRKKHGVSFEEAQGVFADDEALLIHDPDSSEDEDRFLLLGLSASANILVVCHCYREQDELIRIIPRPKSHEDGKCDIRKEKIIMRDEYDFSDGVKKPYAKKSKATVTIRLDKSTVDYFKSLSEQVNMPYQSLINLYLADCAAKKMKPTIAWGQ